MARTKILVMVATAALAAGTSFGVPAVARSGSVGSALVLDSGVEVHGYDAVTDSTGTAYIGWISNSTAPGSPREVHLCVLPSGATACSGGVQTTSSLGDASAQDLKMVLGLADQPLLYWQHQTTDSINGPFGDEIAQSVVTHRVLGSAADIASAPSFGDLGDVAIDPSGAPAWVLLGAVPVSGSRAMYFDYGSFAHPSIPSSYAVVGSTHLAFANGTPVLAIDKYGAITSAVRSSAYVSGSWTTWTNVPNTWSVGGAYDLASSGHTVRLVAPLANAGYHPAQHAWNGTSFGAATPTGDNGSCSPTTMDVASDASGRIASVASSCAGNTVTNLPTDATGGVIHATIGGTPVNTPGPQITTSPRGRGWVAWTRQASSGGDALVVVRVVLPAAYTQMHRSTTFGSATFTAPLSCLPPTSATIKLSARGRNGWRYVGPTLKFDNHVISGTIGGAGLTPGSDHTISGVARFRSPSGTVKSLSFARPLRSCPAP